MIVAFRIAILALCALPSLAPSKAAADKLAELAGISLADRVAPLQRSVVTVATTQKIAEPPSPRLSAPTQPVPPAPGSPAPQPYEDYFDDFLNRREDGERRPETLGSGFIVSAQGYVITNAHVIEAADRIVVMLSSGTRLPARLIGRDSKTDLALLKVEAKEPLEPVTLADSAAVRVGDWVMAIGNPFGLGGSLSVGIVSATKRDIASGPFDDYIQTDAAINRGNSGGPLFDMAGRVVGVNTAILAPMGVSIGVGFAIASNTVKRVADQLTRYGETRRGFIGVKLQSVNEEIAASLGLPQAQGVLVADVTAGGPAESGGLAVGDLVLAFNGEAISSQRALPRMVAETEPGTRVAVDVLRDGERKRLDIALGRMEEQDAAPPPTAPAAERRPDKGWAGLSLARLSEPLRRKHRIVAKLKGVVVTSVESGSLAASRAIATGDVIVEITHKRVDSPEAVYSRLDELRRLDRAQALLTLANARGDVSFITLPIERDTKPSAAR